jgi:hypothetical protein
MGAMHEYLISDGCLGGYVKGPSPKTLSDPPAWPIKGSICTFLLAKMGSTAQYQYIIFYDARDRYSIGTLACTV